MKKRVFLFLLVVLLLPLVFAKSGSMKLLAVSNPDTNPRGTLANIHLEIKEGQGQVFIDSFPLSKIDTQISTRFAKEVACNFLDTDCTKFDFFYTIKSSSSIVGGPSAGAAITILTISVLEDIPINQNAAITGTINTGGIIGPVGGILPKIESAAQEGITKILIPKYSDVNETNLTQYEEKYNVEIYGVSQIQEALSIFTGQEFSQELEVEIDESYKKTMKNISVGLCDRSKSISGELYEEDANNTATRLLDKGITSLEQEQYYSAASFCFGSGLYLRTEKLNQDKLTNSQLIAKINDTKNRADEFKDYTDTIQLNTLTDLETYMAVNDRIFESKERLEDALIQLQNNNTNASIYQLAYAIERLNSAHSWSVFFGSPSSKFVINEEVLEASCLNKISEVEERIEYVNLYLPSGATESREAVKKAYLDYNNGDNELCLYEASIAKAKVDLILNNLAIDPDDVDEVIEDRAKVVKYLIAKQTEKGMFPIVAYSYYEYANSLKDTDKYSALLYLEYALELGNLDLYFEEEKFELPYLNTDSIFIFLSGLLLGMVLTLVLGKCNKK